MPLVLSDWDGTGLATDVLALIRAGADEPLYADTNRGGTDVPIDGELGLGGGETIITRIRVISNGGIVVINDNDVPTELTLSNYFGVGGAGHDLTLYIQTENWIVSTPVSGATSGGGYSNLPFDNSDGEHQRLNSLGEDDLFIFAFARPASDTSVARAQMAIDLGGPSIQSSIRATVVGPARVRIAADLGGPTIQIRGRVAPVGGVSLSVTAAIGGPSFAIRARAETRELPGVPERLSLTKGPTGTLHADWQPPSLISGATIGFEKFVYRIKADQLVNRLLIVGGAYKSEDFTEEFTGDGANQSFLLKHAPTEETDSAVSISGVAQSIGLYGIDGSLPDTSQWENNANIRYSGDEGGLLAFKTAPADGAVISITYKFWIQLLRWSRSLTGHRRLGRWIEGIYKDESIASRQTADAVGLQQMTEKATTAVVVTCLIRDNGLHSGQTIPVTNSRYKLDGDLFLIQKIDTRFIVSDAARDTYIAEHTLQFGQWNFTLLDALLEQRRYSQARSRLREGEILDDALALDSEQLRIDDAVTQVESTGPYHYGDAKYGLSRYTS